MTKKEYIKTIGFVQDLKANSDMLSDALEKFSPEWGCFSNNNAEVDMISIIEMAMNDHDDSWTSYFVYECEFGKVHGDSWVSQTKKNGEKVRRKPSNAGAIYDLIQAKNA